ncbi:MAG: methyltransferase domain-containing protein [Candidatus Blackburnbacteria bacterium]|nr:methyltransferase domain-containing protein [Candidatus Blackburnbacteria bacterium]
MTEAIKPLPQREILPTVGPDVVEKVLSYADPNITFEARYRSLGADLEGYQRKFALARALIEDGRYPQPDFLVRNFVPPGRKVDDPEVIHLSQDLREFARENSPKKKLERLENLVQETATGTTLSGKELQDLLGLFGPSHAVSVLYRHRPEYHCIPVEQVKKVLADYLGDFFYVKGKFNPDKLEKALPFIGDKDLKADLVVAIKEGCLAHYNLVGKKEGLFPEAVVNEYLDILELYNFDDQNWKNLVGELKEYYRSLFHDFPKPDRLVDRLKEGRKFPDFNQFINIKEVADNHRLLVADEMGLGKSASAIFTKEVLGLERALIVVPANVKSTWQEYLSDKVGPNGEQIGYFKPGIAPRVLVLDSLDKVADIPNYEYIVISHNLLKEDYIAALKQAHFDMLIVDEVHEFKNIQEGKWAKNLLSLSEGFEGEGKYVALLSGTPIPNKVQDVAMLLKLLYPDEYKGVDNKALVNRIIQGDILGLSSAIMQGMQMKRLTESVEMPQLTEEIVEVELSPKEKDVYGVLHDEDELTAPEKLGLLRLFLLNPDALEVTPPVESSKIEAVGQKLRQVFTTKDKGVLFVNGYVEDVIRGNKTIIEKLGLPPDVEVRTIEGEVDREERLLIQKELNEVDKKMLLIVSGMTAGVGVNFSGGEWVGFYNEPWTKYEKRQQLARVFRPGLKDNLESTTFIVKGTVEEGIHDYISAKEKAVEKLLRGIPISEAEQEMLRRGEGQTEENLEVNPELARYYFSSWDKLMEMFGYGREAGEAKFRQFLQEWGPEYAEAYVDLQNRSYQANGARVCATVIDELVRKDGKNPAEIRILDSASGPEMLKQHIPEKYQDRVLSVDINPLHFQRAGEGRFVGSYRRLPFQSGVIDYVNLSFAIHYAPFVPSKGQYERLEVFLDMNRVLKTGGKVVINMVYSDSLRDSAKFRNAMSILGFKVVDGYMGDVSSGQNYASHLITLEKERAVAGDVKDIADQLGHNTGGLKFRRNNLRLRDTRPIIEQFNLNDQKHEVHLNRTDIEIKEEERLVTDQAERLKFVYGSVRDIPREEVIQHGFVRLLRGKTYVLFKKLQRGLNVVVVK